MIATPRILAAAVGTALVLTLAACGGSKDETADPDEPRLGPIDQLFEDMYGSYDEEQGNADMLQVEELTAQCMTEQGFEYTPVDYGSMGGDMVVSSDDEIPWDTLEFAQEYGYGITTNPWGDQMDEAELVAEGEEWVDPNQEYVESMSETEQAAYYAALYGDQSAMENMTEDEMMAYEWSWEDGGCSGFAQHEVYGDQMDMSGEDDPYAALMEEMNGMWETIQADPRIAEAESAWAACMSDAGYPGLAKVGEAEMPLFDRSNAIYEAAYADVGPDATEEDYAAIDVAVQDQLAAITAEEIETAVADYTCRDEVDYTRIHTDLNIEYQQEFYDAHKAELDEWAASMADQHAAG